MIEAADLPHLLRQAVAPHCAGGFVRRARNDALFVSDACADEVEGFLVEREGRIAYLTPESEWLARLTAQLTDGEAFLTRSLLKTREYLPLPEADACLIRGIKLLENATPRDVARYDRAVRETAALCLRLKRGNAHASARILEELNGRIVKR